MPILWYNSPTLRSQIGDVGMGRPPLKPSQRKTHLDIIKGTNNKFYGLIRTSFRENGKPKHETLFTLTGYTKRQLLDFRSALAGKSGFSTDDVQVIETREFGASKALFELAKSIGLLDDIYSKREEWVRSALAMIIGRIVYQGSKLALSRLSSLSALWEICGIDTRNIDVEHHCYEPMDRLLERQKAIEKNLAKRNLAGNVAILYDITSTYFEGDYGNCSIVKFGYNRDKKRGHKQIVIGLICTKNGCPISVEVFPGNTKDITTVEGKIKEIRKDFGVTETIFVGDRGMISTENFDSFDGIKTISGLTHSDMKKLIDDNNIQLSLFDENLGTEYISPDNPRIRYALMKNPNRAVKESNKLDDLLNKTEERLKKVANYKRKVSDAVLNQRLGITQNSYKVGKYFTCEAVNGVVSFKRNEEKIEDDKRLHGLYTIRTNVDKELMPIDEVVHAYRDLIGLEQAFRTIKTTELEIRPIYHKTEDRIRAHVFICMLAYYLLWHFKQRIKPLLEADGKGKNRTQTLDYILALLKNIQCMKLDISGIIAERTTKLSTEQEEILRLLSVSFK
jgi:transposase